MRMGKIAAGMTLLCGLFLLFTACQSTQSAQRDNEPSAMQTFDNGVVTAIDQQGKRVLVTQALENDGSPFVRAVWFEITEKTNLTDSQGTAISFDDIRPGHRVEAWNTGPVKESYPEQGEAFKMVLLPETEKLPSGWISKQKAVETALGLHGASDRIWGVAKAVPDLEGEQWEIQLVSPDGPPQSVPIDATSGNIIQLQNDAFRVFSPEPSAEVGSSFTVSGKARVFEANFSWQLEDGHNVLNEGHAAADAGAPVWRPFEFSVEYEAASNPTLMLLLYAASPKDGSREHELVIPLKPQEQLIRYNFQ